MNKKISSTLKAGIILAVVTAPTVALSAAGGGGGGAEFATARTTSSDWLTGDLGITIATAGGIWGLIASVAGNIKMAGLGVGIAAVAALSAPLIPTIFGAVI